MSGLPSIAAIQRAVAAEHGIGPEMLTEPDIKTRSEQHLEWLFQMQKHRKLTNDEWEQVKRCEHAIYCRIKRQAKAEAEAEEARLAEYDERLCG